MSFIAAFILSGVVLINVYLLVRMIVTCRPPRGNRCVRGKNVLPPPSPACERYNRLAER